MTNTIEITIRPPLRDLQGRFTKATTDLLEQKRASVKKLGRAWLMLARTEAPIGKTGRFRASINYRTFQEGSTVGFRGYGAQPLGTWIIEGTKTHPIQANAANALCFFWPKAGRWVVVPKGGGFKTHVRADGKLWIGKGHVDHPGTQPNPYNVRAYDAWRPEAEVELRRISKNYIATLQGKGTTV